MKSSTLFEVSSSGKSTASTLNQHSDINSTLCQSHMDSFEVIDDDFVVPDFNTKGDFEVDLDLEEVVIRQYNKQLPSYDFNYEKIGISGDTKFSHLSHLSTYGNRADIYSLRDGGQLLFATSSQISLFDLYSMKALKSFAKIQVEKIVTLNNTLCLYKTPASNFLRKETLILSKKNHPTLEAFFQIFWANFL